MTPVFGKGVVYDAPLKKRKQQFRFLSAALKASGLQKYPETIAAEARAFLEASRMTSEARYMHTSTNCLVRHHNCYSILLHVGKLGRRRGSGRVEGDAGHDYFDSECNAARP